MESEKAIVDLIHVYDDKNYEIKETINSNHIFIVQEVDKTNNLFYLIKKGNKFSFKTKYLFINRCEKSFELIHPSILNISGFSIDKPFLYYKYIPNARKIDDIKLSDVNIQKIFYGIASGLSYLILHGYYYDNFSISSIFFDKFDCPKLFDYINFDVPNKNSEKNIISKYADILTIIINKKKKQNSELSIHPELQKLIERSKQTKNLPNFNDFIKFFESESYCTNTKVNNNELFQKYLEIFDYIDNIFYYKKYDSIDYDNDSIESISYQFYDKQLNKDYKMKDEDYLFYNSLPEFNIKQIVNVIKPLNILFKQYLLYEDLTLIFPESKTLFQLYNDQYPFKIYKKLTNKIKALEKEKIDNICFTNTKHQFEKIIEALRIHAIHYLKKAFKKSNDVKIKIELAVQYINGSILPYNLPKALNILKEITDADQQSQKLINHMKEKIETTINSMSIKRIMSSLPQKQREILEKAEEEDVLSLLYCAFAFYTGYDGFPIMRALSIQFYRKAAKKSSHAMTLLGQLYLNGIIFPQNFKRATECFKRAAVCGDIKAEVYDCLLRKHLWRSCFIEYDLNDIEHYLPSFNSVMPNDSLVLSRVFNDNSKYENTKSIYNGVLKEENNNLHSEKTFENYGMFFKHELSEIKNKSKDMLSVHYSQKILLSENMEDTKDSKKQTYIAKSYFYGDNGYPVNYAKAAEFYKKAADNGDSEAQWRYAMLCVNFLGLPMDIPKIEKYFHKSIDQNNLEGKLFYALYQKNLGNDQTFECIIQECCDSGNLDAMYYYAMYLENNDEMLNKSIYYYKKAADEGHFYSLIRLIYILKHKKQTKLYEHYLNLSVSFMNESLLVKLIHLYDRKKMFDQSNIIIQIGIKMNLILFNIFYADHLIYGKGMEINIDRAEKIVKEVLQSNNFYAQKYKTRYIFVMSDIYIIRNQHYKAASLLYDERSHITEEFRLKYLLFYQKLNKNIAKEHFFTVNFCFEDYRKCQEILLKLKENKNITPPMVITYLREYAFYNNNAYSLAALGKLYKQGKYIFRNLRIAVQYFKLSAKKACPEGFYYLGKEFFYGRILNQDYNNAKKCFLAALKNYREPRAGYYLYKIPGIKNDDIIDDVISLKTSVYFGYKRALYKYGHRLITGKDHRIDKNEEKGRELIKQSALQNYNRAKRFCQLHSINYKGEEENSYLYQHIFDKNELFYDIANEDSESDDESINSFIFPIKNKKSSGIANEDNKNSEQDNYNDYNTEKIVDINDIKNKKNQELNNDEDIKTKLDVKKDEKNHDLSIDEDTDSISDLIAFWF